jgi:hypothetical protein
VYRGIHCNNSKYAYIVHWLDHLTISPFWPITSRCLFVLFCRSIWGLSTIVPHRNLLCSPSHKYPPTACILQSCLSLLISKLMFIGISECIPTDSILYFQQLETSRKQMNSSWNWVWRQSCLKSWLVLGITVRYSVRLECTDPWGIRLRL